MTSTQSSTPVQAGTEKHADRKLKITIFAAVKSRAPGKRGEITWERAVRFLTDAKETVKDKHDLGLWNPVEFESNLRHNDKAVLVFAFVADIDNEIKPALLKRLKAPPTTIEVTKADGKKVLKLEPPNVIGNVLTAMPNTECCWHTSFSHKPHWPKYRVVWLLSRPVTPAEYEVIWRYLDAKFQTAGIYLDPATKNVSRAWYRAVKREHFEAGHVAGTLLDVDTILAEARPAKVEPTSPRSVQSKLSDATTTDVALEERIRRATAYAKKFPAAISGQAGHSTTFRLACQLVRGFALPVEDALRILVEHYNPRCEPRWSEEELRHKVADALEKGQLPAVGAHLHALRPDDNASTAAGGEAPLIPLGVDTHRVLKQAVVALANERDVYARGTKLVAFHSDDEGTETVEITATVLQVLYMARAARWVQKVKGEWVPTTPPHNVAVAITQLQRWPEMRSLMGIAKTPVMRADGSVLDAPGYDASTGLLYVPTADFGTIPEEPTQADVAQAKATLMQVVQDFPLVPSGAGCWLALLLSYFGRPLFSGAVPGFVVDANTRGAGKGLLVGVTGRVILGHAISVTTPTFDEEELRKRITSMLMKGAPIILVDNIPINRALGNATWDLLLTSEVWEDRVLGVSDTTKVPNWSLWVFTGNNVQVKGDTPRRVLHIRLESPLEKPEQRAPEEFTHPDLLNWVDDNRVLLVRACLILLRAWVVAGRPRGTVHLGSYEGWSATIGACVEWLGFGDVTKTQQEYEDRTACGGGDASDVRPLMMAWKAAFGEEAKTAGEVLQLITEEDRRVETERRRIERQRISGDIDFNDEVELPEHQHAELRDAIVAFAPSKRGDLPAPAWLGRKLSGVLKRVVSGHHFMMTKDRNDVSHWQLLPVGAGASDADAPAPAAGASAGACGGTAGASSENAPAPNTESSPEVEPSAGACGGISDPSDRQLDLEPGGPLVNISGETKLADAEPEAGGLKMPPLPPQGDSSHEDGLGKGAGANPDDAPAYAPACPRRELGSFQAPARFGEHVGRVVAARREGTHLQLQVVLDQGGLVLDSTSGDFLGRRRALDCGVVYPDDSAGWQLVDGPRRIVTVCRHPMSPGGAAITTVQGEHDDDLDADEFLGRALAEI